VLLDVAREEKTHMGEFQTMLLREDDDFVCKVAKSPNEVQGLIENGFEYICDMDDLKFFRKRK
jgi:rubrerythrin